jgi:alkanesulfonate monooxygenase
MTQQILLNAFVMNCIGHQSVGMWRHPRDKSRDYKTIGYWTNLAQTLERGLFDGIFIADVLGVNDVYGGNANAAIRSAAQLPINDPMMLISAMAAATKNLGFGVTCSLTYELPYTFARRMSTLDHLTGGRIGWNIVTSYLNSGARAAGMKKQLDHDARYEMAEEYMSIVYKLWEASWDNDAIVADAESGVFALPERVHTISHEGPFFSLDAIHLCEPSPQRTPVLYQAGSSPKGMSFATRHAECIFINGPSKEVIGSYVKRIRAELVKQGRTPHSARIFSMATIVTAPTPEGAKEKLAEYRRYVSREGAFALLSGWAGLDFSQLDPDQSVKHVKTDSMQTAIDRFSSANPDKTWTVGEMADFAGLGGAGPVFVGSPQEIADQMEAWIAETGVDGLNLAYTVMPECFVDFVDLVVPELQRRGLYKTEYRAGSLREKLFHRGDRLAAPHIGASFRENEDSLRRSA